MLKKERANQRNITPSFLPVKHTSKPKSGKTSTKLTLTKDVSHDPDGSHTNRSASKASSRRTIETYERRVLHLSKLSKIAIIKREIW